MTIPTNFVLIDDESVCNMLHQICIEKNFNNTTISKFTSAKEGLKFIEQQLPEKQPTIVLLDIQMPLFSGWDVLREIEQLPRHFTDHLLVIMVGSAIDSQDRMRARNSSIVRGCIEKPLTRSLLDLLFQVSQAA